MCVKLVRSARVQAVKFVVAFAVCLLLDLRSEVRSKVAT